MSTFPSELDSFLTLSEQQAETPSSDYEQQVHAQVEQLGPEPSLTQAVTLLLTQSAKAEHEARQGRQQLENNLRQAVNVVKSHHSEIETIKESAAVTENTVVDLKDGQIYLEERIGQMEYIVNKTYSMTCENRQRNSKGNFVLRGKEIPKPSKSEDLVFIVRDLVWRKYGLEIHPDEFKAMHRLPGDGILFVLNSRMPGWSYEQLVRWMNFNPKPEVEVYCCIQLFEPYSELFYIARRLKYYKVSSYYRLDENGYSYIALNEQSKAFKFTNLEQLIWLGLQVPQELQNELHERKRKMLENETQSTELNLRKAQEPRPYIPPKRPTDPNQHHTQRTPPVQNPNQRPSAPATANNTQRPAGPAPHVQRPTGPAPHVQRPTGPAPAPNYSLRPRAPAPNYLQRPTAPAPNHFQRPPAPAPSHAQIPLLPSVPAPSHTPAANLGLPPHPQSSLSGAYPGVNPQFVPNPIHPQPSTSQMSSPPPGYQPSHNTNQHPYNLTPHSLQLPTPILPSSHQQSSFRFPSASKSERRPSKRGRVSTASSSSSSSLTPSVAGARFRLPFFETPQQSALYRQ